MGVGAAAIGCCSLQPPRMRNQVAVVNHTHAGRPRKGLAMGRSVIISSVTDRTTREQSPVDPTHGPAATRRLCEIRLVDDFLYPMVRARAVSLAESVHSAKSQRNCLSRIEIVRSSHRTEIRSCPLTRRALNSSSIAGLSADVHMHIISPDITVRSGGTMANPLEIPEVSGC